MRKVILEFNPKLLYEFVPKHFFDPLEAVDVKLILKIDLEKGVKLLICDFYLKPNYTLDSLSVKGFTILNVLKIKNNNYTCLIRTEYSGNILSRTNIKFEDIIFDLPVSLSKTKCVISFIAEFEIIKQFINHLKLILGDINIVSMQNYTFSDVEVLSSLTTRQKEILLLAKKSGYYELPRKVTTEEIASKLGISKSTIIEHLRKAENRIITSLLEGL